MGRHLEGLGIEANVQFALKHNHCAALARSIHCRHPLQNRALKSWRTDLVNK